MFGRKFGRQAATLACFIFTGLAQAQSDQVSGKGILHSDGSRTLSVQDPAIFELQEITYDRQDILITRRIFRLDDAGRALSGMIYDGANQLLARVQFGFDNLGRLVEERTTSPSGGVIRRLLYTYDNQGNKLKPQAYNYDPTGQRAPVATRANSSLVTPGINHSVLSAGDRIDPNYRLPESGQPRPGSAGSGRHTGTRDP